MEGTDKTIEVMKAAMEKEKEMKDQTKKSMGDTIDTDGQYNNEEEIEIDRDDMSADVADEEGPEIEVAEVDEECEADNATQDKTTKNGKSLFKNSKNKELAAKDQKIDELTDRLKRQMAEFDNFRKRSEKEKSQNYEIGAKSVIETLLPIVDNFERGLGTLSETEKEGAFAQGIELIYKQLMTALEEIGVKPIEAVGKEFDPNFHNAVMHGEDESMGENIISDEFQKGYMYRESVVRHSMVKVVN